MRCYSKLLVRKYILYAPHRYAILLSDINWVLFFLPSVISDDLLNFTKLEAGKASLDPIDFYVEDALVDAIELLITLASKKRIDLSYFVKKDVPRIVKGDASKLRQ